MSETVELEVTPTADIVPPNMTVTPKQVALASGTVENRFVVTFGNPQRTIEVMPLDLGMQFDLAEVAGTNGSNLQWMQMAYAAAATKAIDGLPLPSATSKATLRNTLNRLGMDGFKAAALVANGYRGGPGIQADAPKSDDGRDAVKN